MGAIENQSDALAKLDRIVLDVCATGVVILSVNFLHQLSARYIYDDSLEDT